MREDDEHEKWLAKERDISRLQSVYALLSTEADRALEELENMANQGSVLSMLYLANAYQRGPRADLSKAEHWYKAAYENGALNAYSGLGVIYWRQHQYDRAEKVLADGVSHDDSVSMYWLAKIYLERSNYKERLPEIMRLLERSSALGQIRAKNRLAFLLMQGRGGLTSIPRGFILYLCSLIEGFNVGIRNPDDRRLW